MSAVRRNGRSRQALNLVELLVVLLVLGILAAWLLPRYLHRSSGAAQGGYRGPVAAAQDTVCRSNLNQLRASIQAMSASDPEGRPPRDLSDLGMPAEMYRCPTGGETYRYDPATGRVQCPHPGHEGY